MSTKHEKKTHLEELGEFTTDARVITIALIAIVHRFHRFARCLDSAEAASRLFTNIFLLSTR